MEINALGIVHFCSEYNKKLVIMQGCGAAKHGKYLHGGVALLLNLLLRLLAKRRYRKLIRVLL